MLPSALKTYCKFGDILLFHYPLSFNRYSLVGWCIQRILRESYGHCAVYAGDNRVFEAMPNGVGYSDLSWVPKGTRIDIMRLTAPMDVSDHLYLLEEMQKLVGKKYDYTAAFYLGLMRALQSLRIIGSDWKGKLNPLDDPNEYFCFQLVVQLYRYHGLLDIKAGNATGKDIFSNWNAMCIGSITVE